MYHGIGLKVFLQVQRKHEGCKYIRYHVILDGMILGKCGGQYLMHLLVREMRL